MVHVKHLSGELLADVAWNVNQNTDYKVVLTTTTTTAGAATAAANKDRKHFQTSSRPPRNHLQHNVAGIQGVRGHESADHLDRIGGTC